LKDYQQDSLSLAELIVNTRDTTKPEPEYLRAPADLARYLESWGITPAEEPRAQDLAEVLALRERLRSVFESGDMEVAVGILNELLEGVRVTPRVGMAPDGGVTLKLELEERLPLARRLAAEAALSLSAVLNRYGVERLHVCSATPCTDVFVDTSRNHTRRYCCEQCANRHNVAAHRQRQRAAEQAKPQGGTH
jgi:predicted RNA-binding Zn ribbon-like protein